MKHIFDFGKIDYEGTGINKNLVTVEMAYTEDGNKKRFSVCGNIWNTSRSDIVCGGQCLDTIAEYIKTPLFKTIYRLWKEYHLNDMHPECEHQAAMQWREKAAEKVTLYHWRLTREAAAEQKAAEKAAIAALQAGETFTPTAQQTFVACMPYSLTTHTPAPADDIARYYEPKKPLFTGDKGHTEEKTLGWLHEEEHPEGLLCKPCPVCGYKYGSAWKYFPIPAHDEQLIFDLLRNGGLNHDET